MFLMSLNFTLGHSFLGWDCWRNVGIDQELSAKWRNNYPLGNLSLSCLSFQILAEAGEKSLKISHIMSLT